MARGPKLATTKETVLTPQHKADGGGVQISGRLNFVATLFSSKSGKATGFSDKAYRVSVLALKPTFGTSKRSLKEVASCEINISEYAVGDGAELGRSVALKLDPKKQDGTPIVLELTLSARVLRPGVDDDDDDGQSTSSALTGFDAAQEVASEASEAIRLEQDLRGFPEAAPGGAAADGRPPAESPANSSYSNVATPASRQPSAPRGSHQANRAALGLDVGATFANPFEQPVFKKTIPAPVHYDEDDEVMAEFGEKDEAKAEPAAPPPMPSSSEQPPPPVSDDPAKATSNPFDAPSALNPFGRVTPPPPVEDEARSKLAAFRAAAAAADKPAGTGAAGDATPAELPPPASDGVGAAGGSPYNPFGTSSASAAASASKPPSSTNPFGGSSSSAFAWRL